MNRNLPFQSRLRGARSPCAPKGDARHISSDRTGVLPSPPAEKRSSPRAIQRNDMADDMTKLNEFQALNNEELDSVSAGCKCTGDTLSQRKLVYSCKEEK